MGNSSSWSLLSGALCPSLTFTTEMPPALPLTCIWPGAGAFSSASCRGCVSPQHHGGSAEDSVAPSTRASKHSGVTSSSSPYEPHRVRAKFIKVPSFFLGSKTPWKGTGGIEVAFELLSLRQVLKAPLQSQKGSEPCSPGLISLCWQKSKADD